MKHRSLINYSDIMAADEQGHNIGLDAAIFLREETTPRTFNAPRIGTQGKSVGDVGASIDISAGTDSKLNVNLRGAGVLLADLAPVGALSTGALIAAAMESAINTALIAANNDERVWVLFDGGDDHYEVYDQRTGLLSSVVITDAVADNVADDLKIGVANAGAETVGTDDQDALQYTTGGATHGQPVESNTHRSSRYHSDVIKKKKVAEFDIDTFVNMRDPAGDSLDTAVRLLWKSILGTETVYANEIRYTQGLPNTFFSLVKVSTIKGEYFTGDYGRDLSLSFLGDGPATCKFTGKAQKASIAGIGQVDGAVVANADVILKDTQTKRYFNEGNNKARVMIMDPDGRTIVAGADGSLVINVIDHGTKTLTLSAVVSVADLGFVVPWHPGAVQETKTDNISTDLEGSFRINSTGAFICVTGIDLGVVNDHTDRDNCFGQDANYGFIAGNRMTATLSVTFDLSNDNFQDVVQAREFAGFSPEIILGDPTTGRALKITAPNWKPSVPALEDPENGPSTTTLEGILYQSTPGAKDPIQVSFL